MPDSPSLTMALDYYDLIWVSDELFDEQKIDRFLGTCAEKGIEAVQWRLSVCGQLLYHTRTGDMFTDQPWRNDPLDGSSSAKQIHEKCKAILRQFDPLEAAIRLARKHGLKLYPWLTLYDDFGSVNKASSLVRDHPEWCWAAKDGSDYYLGVVSYVYPEVREFRMRQIEEILAYGGDGLYLSNRSHSRPQMYRNALTKFVHKNPELGMTEFHETYPGLREKMMQDAIGCYGFDMPAIQAFKEKTGNSPQTDLAEWWRFRGAYFNRFLEQVAKRVHAQRIPLSFGLHYSTNEPYFIYGSNFFAWQEYLDKHVIDELHCLNPTDALAALNPGNTTLHGWLWLADKPLDDAIMRAKPIIRALEQGLIQGVLFFEAFRFIQVPELWNLPVEFKTR